MAWWATPAEQGGRDQHSHVVQVANGQQHALLLTDEGIVYSWGGKNEKGQLGRTGTEKMQAPCPVIDAIRDEIIVQIACGMNHCLVLSQSGALFAWGYNKAGQVGIKGFKSSISDSELCVRKPHPVHGFDGKTPSMLAKSCSCGPESSACVTQNGEVYVWGAISYYFSAGGQYDEGENFTLPVRVRGVPEVCRPLSRTDELSPRAVDSYVPDQIALYKDQFACTIAQRKPQDHLTDIIRSLKERSTQLAKVIKGFAAESAGGRDDEGQDDPEELKNLSRDLEKRKREIDEQISNIRKEQATCKTELQRIGRELTICDQQETALAERASMLEVKRSEVSQARGAAEQRVFTRALETQLKDIDHFKDSNQRSKLQFFERREALERQNLRLTTELTQMLLEKQKVEGQEKLILSLRDGDFGKSDSVADDGLKIAVSKAEEMAATEPQVLSGVGRFTGFREVMAISEKALRDVSSALKEVSAASSAGDGVLESVLEQNLKLRKECNAQISQKLALAGGDGGKARPNLMVEFYQEVSQERQQRRASNPAITEGSSLGFLRLM